LKKKKKENIILAAIGIIIVTALITFNYSAEQTKLKGFEFGNDLQTIQDELKKLESEFESKITLLKENGMTEEEFVVNSDKHIEKMEDLILSYDELLPPKTFESAVSLFKLSAQSQLESDIRYIQWVTTGDESEEIRANALFQESFEYELAALAEYNSAKLGLKP